MYYYLHGQLTVKNPLFIVIDCHGVGFEVRIPLSTYDRLPELKETVHLYTHYYVSEEDIRLYGFATEEEKAVFRKLISISRIGPKLALSILSTMSVAQLISSILKGDDKSISKVPGLGSKSAQRLIVELKDKLDGILLPHEDTVDVNNPDILQEAEIALLTLGYSKIEIRKSFNSIPLDSLLTTEQIIKATIQYQYRTRNQS